MTARSDQSRTYRVFGDRLLVMSESESLAEQIHCFLKDLAVADEENEAATVRFAVFSAPQEYVTVCCPEVGLAEAMVTGRRAWIAFRQLFLHLLVNGQYPHYVMHASCVADSDGRTAIISGAQRTACIWLC